MKDKEKGYLKLEDIAVNVKCNTIYPGGTFEGFVVPHEETITIAKSLEVREEDIIYRPTVMFVYAPCEYATKYLLEAKVNDYPNPDPDKPQDFDGTNENTIVRGHEYPREIELLYIEKISEGTEYVGVLLLGENFKPVWVGNRVELPFLCKGSKAKNSSYWQTPTITPVAMSALAAVSWMIKNKDKGGIYFPDDILDYKYIIKLAEKYISKTIYKTFTKEEVEEGLHIKLDELQMEDMWVEKA
jgi:homospermidine synthase